MFVHSGVRRPALLLGLCTAALSAPQTVHGQQRITLPAADQPLTVQQTDVFTVGKAEGAAHETLGNIFGAAFDAAGNLYVLDAGSKHIQVYDPRGNHLRTIGRAGGGPGEFLAPIAFVIDRDGNVLVNDLGKGSVQVLSPTGEYLRTEALPPGSQGMPRMRAMPQGGVVVQTQARMEQRYQDGLPRTGSERVLTWLTFADPPTRALYTAPPEALNEVSSPSQSGTFAAVMPPVFAPRLLWTVSQAGLVAAAHSEHYSITVSDANGTPLRTLERPLQPRRITERDRRAYAESRQNTQLLFVAAPGARSSSMPPALPENTVFAERMPVIQSIAADRQERLWVRRADVEGVQLVDLLTTDGRYLGTLRETKIPDAFGPGGLVAEIGTGEFGTPIVTVRRMRVET